MFVFCGLGKFWCLIFQSYSVVYNGKNIYVQFMTRGNGILSTVTLKLGLERDIIIQLERKPRIDTDKKKKKIGKSILLDWSSYFRILILGKINICVSITI